LSGLDVHVEVERAVSGRLYLDAVWSRRQVQRTLRIVELVDRARVGAVNGDSGVAGRDREADTPITLARNVGQGTDWVAPVVPRVIVRIVERISKEDPEANAEARMEPEPVPESVMEMVSVKS
jgi:hypothetical protein